MTTASRSLATALWRARFVSRLLPPSYTTSWDTTISSSGKHGHKSAKLGGLLELMHWFSRLIKSAPERALMFG